MRNIEYKYFIIGEDITVEKLMEKVGRVVREAPVIFDGETFIGGFEDYITYLSRGQ